MYIRTPLPQAIVDKLGEICLVLPEVHEEQAWVGRRWMVRKKNFAHALMIDNGYPPTYARMAKVGKANDPVCVLTFRTPMPAKEQPRFASKPYFVPGWWPNIVGMEIDEQTNWHAVMTHVQESYCVLAPMKLVALIGLGWK
jgi:hypothetical protein